MESIQNLEYRMGLMCVRTQEIDAEIRNIVGDRPQHMDELPMEKIMPLMEERADVTRAYLPVLHAHSQELSRLYWEERTANRAARYGKRIAVAMEKLQRWWYGLSF